MNDEDLPKAQWLSSDIISTLPQTIIENILCLLPIQEAARTSILAREWRYKWTKIPKLVFYWNTVPKSTSKKEDSFDMRIARKNMDRMCKLFYAIQQVLLLHQGPIHEFTFYADLGHNCSEVDQIILHLSRNHSLKKLTLGFGDDEEFYKLPFCAFSLHQLTELTLLCVNLDHQPIFSGFRSLRSLCLKGVEINTKALLHLLSNCPSLTTFSLLDGSGHIGDNDCTIVELFECLPMIKYLTLSSEVIQRWLVLDPVPEELTASLIHLKYFCIQEMCFTDQHGLVFLVLLIKCSPNLKKIAIKSSESHYCGEGGVSSAILAKCSDVWLEHLNELEIDLLFYFKAEMEFVKLILARSPKLKKASLRIADEPDEDVLTVLLRAPRASPVEIIVE